MKKIILILICLMLTGCNYIELNDMGIVTMLAIEYKDNNYNLTIEVEENKKEETTSVLYKSSGSSIEKALEDASLKIDKNLYFIDVDVVMIDSKTANSKFTSIIDYLTRDVMFGTNFNILIDDDIDNTIKVIKGKEKIAGEYLKNIFDNKTNNIINNKFHIILKSYLSEYEDIILPYGKVNNDEYSINEAVIFKDKQIVSKIPLNMIESFNLLNNETSEYFYQINYQDKSLVYRVSEHDAKLKYNNMINIDLNVNGSFIEIEDIDLEDENMIDEVLMFLKEKIKEEANLLINECKTYDSDILAFKKLYYNNERKKIDSIRNMDYKINVNVKLDREGLIFNSLGDEYERDK